VTLKKNATHGHKGGLRKNKTSTCSSLSTISSTPTALHQPFLQLAKNVLPFCRLPLVEIPLHN